jgi:hypothetical protein
MKREKQAFSETWKHSHAERARRTRRPVVASMSADVICLLSELCFSSLKVTLTALEFFKSCHIDL